MPARLTALIEGCGLRARPLRQARGWGYHRLSALGTILVIDAAPPPPQKMADAGFGIDPRVRAVGRRPAADRQLRRPRSRFRPIFRTNWSRGFARPPRTARWCLPTPTRPTSLPTARSARASRTSTIDRSEDNDASRLEASHDGYVRAFGLVHKRSLMLGNDGKELRGADQLIAKGRKKIREVAPYAVRFHLAPGVEATITADGMGAILRSKGAPPWNFRCRGGNLATEESLWIDGRGQPQRTTQLVIVGEVSALGGEIGWQFRRAS